MVETAPLPAGFEHVVAPAAPPAEEADSSPPVTRETQPLEEWDPQRPIEPVISRPLPGGGYLSATRTALQRLADGEARIRQMMGPGIKHAATREAERRQAEAEAEEKRKASNPLAVLRQSHVLQAEAQAAVDRLQGPLSRARQLAADLVGRTQQRAAAATAGDQAAAEALITALAAGEAPPPVEKLYSDTAEAEATAAELRTARAALAKLASESTAAADRLARCRAGVARCALNVLAYQAADLANEILDTAAELDTRRADLDALGRLLASEGRRLNGHPLPLPARVNRALYPADRQLVGTARLASSSDWHRAYAALIEDPGEVEACPLPDTVETEAP